MKGYRQDNSLTLKWAWSRSRDSFLNLWGSHHTVDRVKLGISNLVYRTQFMQTDEYYRACMTDYARSDVMCSRSRHVYTDVLTMND